MINSLKKIFSSIAVKLFLSFWLITIASIAITRFVSIQLEQEGIIVPIHHGDLHRLGFITRRIAHNSPSSVKELLRKFPIPNDESILLKDPQSQQVFHNRKRHLFSVAAYLGKNELTNQTSVQFPFARLTGPVDIKIQGKNYQLFLANRTRPPAIGSMLLQLPNWAKYVIPLLVSMSLCWLIARSLTKPLIAITKASADIGNGNYQVRVSDAANRNDELGEMAHSFNQMAEKLEANISAHQRLLADVSHELRSPMTRLQMALGLIQQSNKDNSFIDKHILRCEKEVSELDSLITNILSLSRLENNFQQITFERFAIDTLCKQLIEDNQYLADEKALTLHLICDNHLMIEANETLLKSALNNIVNNAIRYSPTDETITIDCQQVKQQLKISITDNGTGVPEQQLPLLFTAFYRVSDARERASGGTGLGLAIARQVIEIHHGVIKAENNHSGGLTITLELPIKQS